MDAVYRPLEKLTNTCSLLYGPPFPTGQPHYGHVLNMFMKDALLSYFCLFGSEISGQQVRFDVHGLPTEIAVQKILEMERGTPVDPQKIVQEIGLGAYNQMCREYLLKVIEGWVPTVKRLCSTITVADHDLVKYTTMDFAYMDRLFQLFGKLHQKSLVYLGYKVQPYSAPCQTAISKIEAKQNRVDVTETSVYVLFPIKDQCTTDKLVKKSPNGDLHGQATLVSPGEQGSPWGPISCKRNFCNFLVWTTTPFTLLSNTALCVNRNLTYATVCDDEDDLTFVCLESFYQEKLANGKLFPAKKGKKPKSFRLLETYPGSSLVGKEYSPLFNENTLRNEFRVIEDDYVDSSGTGIVHNSPAHGEEDYSACLRADLITKEGLGVYDPLDAKCCFYDLKIHRQLNGREARSCNPEIIKLLKANGALYQTESITHSLPHCWRTDTPLYYKAVECVYIDTRSLLPKMQANLARVNFVGDVGQQRMSNCLDMAPDWCVSRSRIWGTPIPIWINREKHPESDGADPDFIVIGSAQELEQMAKVSIHDLHTDVISNIVIQRDGKSYVWIGYTFDCWYESGAQFFAETGQLNRQVDFICEGLDQTRGWFYTLLVLATALDQPAPYRNLLINGIVLASNGKRLEKKKNNYREVNSLLDQYGVDSLRLCLLGSLATKGLPFRFREQELREFKRRVLIPFVNTGKFYQEYRAFLLAQQVPLDQLEPKPGSSGSSDPTDLWIETQLTRLAHSFKEKITNYQLSKLTDLVTDFVDLLSRKYLAHARDRFKLRHGIVSAQEALFTLERVLTGACYLLAPLLSESVQEIRRYLSGSGGESDFLFLDFPFLELSDSTLTNERIVNKLYDVIVTIGAYRSQKNVPGKRPINQVLFGLKSTDLDLVPLIKPYLDWALNEANCLSLEFVDLGSHTLKTIEPNRATIGKSFGKWAPKIVEKLNSESIGTNHTCTIKLEEDEFVLDDTHFSVGLQYKMIPGYEFFSDHDVTIYLDLAYNQEIEEKYLLRLVLKELQKTRKEKGFRISDEVNVEVLSDSPELVKLMEQNHHYWSQNYSGQVKFTQTTTAGSVTINLTHYQSKLEIQMG